jgi:adenosine deaminase CECR1
VSLSTDDEGIFGTDMTNEFTTAIAHTDISYAEVRQLIINSIATSFAAPEEKDALLALVENDLREFEQSWATSRARD